MYFKPLAVLIAASLGVTSLSVAAQTTGASAKRHAAHQAKTAPAAVNQQEIALLKAQLAALQAKVEALSQQSAAQATAVAQSQATATASAAAVARNQASVQRIEAARPRLDALEKFVNNTELNGTIFYDFTGASHKERGANGIYSPKDSHGTTNGAGFDMKRFYLSITHTFSKMWSANLTTDFNYSSSLGQTSLFVKKAYLQGDFSKYFIVRAGSANSPWIPFVEDLYHYRFFENTITDRSIDGGHNSDNTGVGSFGQSADWGLHAMGGTKGDNSFTYQLSAVNGNGFRNPSRSGHVDLEGRVSYSPIKELTLAVGGYDGKRGKDNVADDAKVRTTQRANALIVYRNDSFGVGVEYFNARNWDDVLHGFDGSVLLNNGDKANGYSVFADWSFARRWALFGRHDQINYHYWTGIGNSGAHYIKDEYYNAGVSFDPIRMLRFALGWKYDTLRADDQRFAYKTNEIGLWGQVLF